MQLASSKGVRSEINVTPLIDVVLVLLIIFMVVTPLLESRFVLAVPESDVPEEEPPPDNAPQALLVRLEADGTIKLNGEPVALDALVAKLEPTLRRRAEKVVFFDAAANANYGLAVDVMDTCRGAGAKHVGVIEPQADGFDLPPAPPGLQ